MKSVVKIPLLTVAVLFASFPLLHAASTDDLAVMEAAVEATAATPAGEVPEMGTFWSAEHAPGSVEPWPPLPGSLGLSAWNLGDNVWLLDDLPTATPARAGMAMDDSPPDFGDTNSDGGGYSYNFVPLTLNSNGLWLEITNTDSNWVYLNLHNGTDTVYAVWSSTNLAAGAWNVEAELWPMGDQTNVLPFTVPTLGQPSLLVKAMDWTDVWTNGLPCWWVWEYFGTTNLSATNLDSQGSTLLYDYQNGLDPNVINFTVSLGNQQFNTATATGQYAVAAGTPSYEAVLVNDTNLNDAVWQPYDGTVHLGLGSTDGVYQVTLGLKGRAPSSTATWLGTAVWLAQTPPVLTLTNPASGIVAVPYIQVQGLANARLASVTCDVSNALGVVAGLPGSVTGELLDPNRLTFTTNTFQCDDVPLTNGVNVITVHGTDWAGNTGSASVSCTLDYSGKTNPPIIQLTWPPDGQQIGQGNITVYGTVGDPTASVSLQVTDDAGDTNCLAGVVERDGHFWIANVPLNGTNTLALTAVDVASNVAAMKVTVIENEDAGLTVSPVGGDLWESSATVSGTIGDDSDAVYVNGVEATNDGYGGWTACGVPVNPENVAVFNVQAVNADGTSAAQWAAVKPAALKLAAAVFSDESLGGGVAMLTAWQWVAGQGGGYELTTDYGGGYWVTEEATILADRSVLPQAYYTNSDGDSGYGGTYDGDEYLGGWVADFPQEVGSLVVPGPGQWEQKSGAASWVLHTGGLSVAGNNESLLALTGTATAEVPGTGYDAGLLVQGSGVAGPDITNTGQVEDTNNTAYLVLPDGTTTQSAMIPNVPLARVNNALGQYTLVASANSQWLGDGGTTPNPQFCVGQQVTFAPSWIPSTPPYLNAVAHWSLPGTFVNTNSDPNCDRYYSEDPSQLNRVQTSCWYVDKLQSGSATLAMNLTLNNGQQVILNASGQFNVFRPTTAQASPYQPDGTPTAEITNVTYNVWMGKTIQKTLLSLSLGDGNGHNDMSFSHTINPGNFSGQAGYVQLITSADVVNSDPQTAPLNYTALDGALGEFPADRQTTVPSNTTTSLNKFYDGPAVPLPIQTLQPVWEDVAFSTYLMFRPDPQTNSIWVPLRLITWGVHDEADPNWSALINNDHASTTTNPSGDDHESTAFPDWTAPY